MALTVEDGTGLTAADSYGTEADASTYVSGRYGAADAFAVGTAAQQEQWLRLAAQQLDLDYGSRLKGTRKLVGQGLLWPRKDVVDNEGYEVDNSSVPTRVKYSQFEYARRIAAGTDPLPDLERGGSVRRQKVDVIEVEYFEKATSTTTFQVVDNYMAPYLFASKSEVFFQRS